MAPNYSEIYRNRSDEYDLLVEREDFQGNLDAALRALPGTTGNIVELAAGTGRLTRRLVTRADHIAAYDIEPSMLAVARSHLALSNPTKWSLGVADFRSVPQPDGAADLVIEGWGIGHLMVWNKSEWREVLDTALVEMGRMVRPGGTVAIIESLGTGAEEPRPPNEILGQFYAHLEDKEGFIFQWLRTDYRFASPGETERLLKFFFGDDLASAWAGETVVPECTGIWSKQILETI